MPQHFAAMQELAALCETVRIDIEGCGSLHHCTEYSTLRSMNSFIGTSGPLLRIPFIQLLVTPDKNDVESVMLYFAFDCVNESGLKDWTQLTPSTMCLYLCTFPCGNSCGAISATSS
jgi:hypothetical protein